MRREQEFEKLRSEVGQVRGERADVDSTVDELRVEVARLSSSLEEQAQGRLAEMDQLKKEVVALQNRVSVVEQAGQNEAIAQRAREVKEEEKSKEKEKATYETAKTLFDEGKFDESVEMCRIVIGRDQGTEEARKAQFLLGESLFNNKDYASATLAFAEFRKLYPKDPLGPNAIYRQAMAFAQLGKTKEAKLFLADLVDRYPKSPLSAKAKKEMKKLAIGGK